VPVRDPGRDGYAITAIQGKACLSSVAVVADDDAATAASVAASDDDTTGAIRVSEYQ
jgi:hypothetical protein